MLKEETFKDKMLEGVAEEMCIAARTAPKGRGIDMISTAILKGNEINPLSEKMKEIGETFEAHSFLRDAENIKASNVIVLIGTKLGSLGVKACNYCGFNGCIEREKNPPAICAFNAGDLGIAIGSALSIASDHRVDNRLMFSVGKAAIDLNLLDSDVKIAYGIPLSATGKNPFFDRK